MTSTLPARSALCHRIIAHCVHAVGAAQPQRDPFPHVQIREFFPSDVYQKLLEKLPESHKYHGLNYGTPLAPGEKATRYRFMFNAKGMQMLDEERRELWAAVRDALAAPELKEVVFSRLSAGLSLRFGVPEELTAAVKAYPLPELFRETSGYSIKPHPDTRRKVVTMQIALPQDESQADLGTEFYKLSLNPLHLLREPRGFVTVKRMPFVPNAAYAFSVLNTIRLRSWHGRTMLTTESGVRNSILNIWYADTDELYPEILAQYGKAA